MIQGEGLVSWLLWARASGGAAGDTWAVGKLGPVWPQPRGRLEGKLRLVQWPKVGLGRKTSLARGHEPGSPWWACHDVVVILAEGLGTTQGHLTWGLKTMLGHLAWGLGPMLGHLAYRVTSHRACGPFWVTSHGAWGPCWVSFAQGLGTTLGHSTWSRGTMLGHLPRGLGTLLGQLGTGTWGRCQVTSAQGRVWAHPKRPRCCSSLSQAGEGSHCPLS